jgi:hypothetical protein
MNLIQEAVRALFRGSRRGRHNVVTNGWLILGRRYARLNYSHSRWWGCVHRHPDYPRWWNREAKLSLEQHRIRGPIHGCVPLQHEAYNGGIQLRRWWWWRGRRRFGGGGGEEGVGSAVAPPREVTSSLGAGPAASEARGKTMEEATRH